MKNDTRIILSIRVVLVVFIVGLVLSGISAIPIESEIRLLLKLFGNENIFIGFWLNHVYEGILYSKLNYPFLMYGTDWLAFAHIMIGVVFIGPLVDPVKNIWVIQFGLIACAMVIPFALIFGYIREIPFTWRLIDCSFGIFGSLPLLLVLINIKKLKNNLSYENKL